jgi:DNA-binding GntR family transcriptional regulator
LNVSRSPVQIALSVLVAQGLVDLDRGGYRVRPLTTTLIEEAHGVRCALELYAAEQTIEQVSSDEVERFRTLLERTVACVDNFEFVDKHEYMLANKAFHEYIVDLAGNETLSTTYRSLNIHELMERVMFGPTRSAGNSSDEHRAIVAAYEARDLPAARAAILANVGTGKRLSIEMIEASGGSV